MVLLEQTVGSGSEIVVLTINRPHAKNALNGELVEGLKQTINRLEQEDRAMAVIIKGAEGNFAAGADIKEMATAPEEKIAEIAGRVGDLHEQIASSPMIFISCIEGYCLGGGFELSLVTDIRIAHADATFGLPEVNLGILPGGWGTQLFTALAGSSNAGHYLLSGEFFSSERAHGMGLVSLCTDEPYEESLRLAGKIAAQSRPALWAIKQLISGQQLSVLRKGLKSEREHFLALFKDGEAREGLAAFMEKRQPTYSRGAGYGE
ncbi:enoyl-CoA hydratase/isomerase family protein [Bhargavaea massiliensis]|uniref:enoyl-CoA hydratase/isomerase family protein n=1 Tax=Bhargavaea massiliensis TaxID=2697500 RepID=UPI001F1DE7BD|nr:enoyl-CoA hydratase/isomerase family protein [Bhargavaea massiliensis]